MTHRSSRWNWLSPQLTALCAAALVAILVVQSSLTQLHALRSTVGEIAIVGPAAGIVYDDSVVIAGDDQEIIFDDSADTHGSADDITTAVVRPVVRMATGSPSIEGCTITAMILSSTGPDVDGESVTLTTTLTPDGDVQDVVTSLEAATAGAGGFHITALWLGTTRILQEVRVDRDLMDAISRPVTIIRWFTWSLADGFIEIGALRVPHEDLGGCSPTPDASIALRGCLFIADVGNLPPLTTHGDVRSARITVRFEPTDVTIADGNDMVTVEGISLTDVHVNPSEVFQSTTGTPYPLPSSFPYATIISGDGRNEVHMVLASVSSSHVRIHVFYVPFIGEPASLASQSFTFDEARQSCDPAIRFDDPFIEELN